MKESDFNIHKQFYEMQQLKHISKFASNVLYSLGMKIRNVEATTGSVCSAKKSFLEISQNSQENTCARDSFLIKL